MPFTQLFMRASADASAASAWVNTTGAGCVRRVQGVCVCVSCEPRDLHDGKGWAVLHDGKGWAVCTHLLQRHFDLSGLGRVARRSGLGVVCLLALVRRERALVRAEGDLTLRQKLADGAQLRVHMGVAPRVSVTVHVGPEPSHSV